MMVIAQIIKMCFCKLKFRKTCSLSSCLLSSCLSCLFSQGFLIKLEISPAEKKRVEEEEEEEGEGDCDFVSPRKQKS